MNTLKLNLQDLTSIKSNVRNMWTQSITKYFYSQTEEVINETPEEIPFWQVYLGY
ncbi:MAG: hypothetical protein LBU90_07765 [Bacteroidales bacterium]|nr:hypothetical protein [Bacteroidales bacterium]